MNRLIDIASNALSIILYPLFVPTYGVALFCYAYSAQVHPLPWIWTVVALTGTLLLTCILPATSIWMLIRQGRVRDMQIENASERRMPYLYAAIGFGFWSYLLITILKAPACLNSVALGATAAIAIVALINRYWKISAHLTGLGGLFGGTLAYCLATGIAPAWSAYGVWLALTLLLMYARLRLNAHTPAQVAAGWLLGIACTFIPYLVYQYAA